MKILILLVAIILSSSGCTMNKDHVNNARITINEIGKPEEKATEENDMTDSEVLLELCSDEKEVNLSTKEIKVRLVNNSEQVISIGEVYMLENFSNNEWIEIPISIAYEDIAYIIAVGEEKNFICMIDGISESGLYRIRKPYSVDNEDGTSSMEYVYVEFFVKNSL